MSTHTLHLADHELLRLADGAADDAEQARWRQHLDTCSRCTEEMDQIRSDAALFSSTLAAAAWEDGLPERPPFAVVAPLRVQARPRAHTRFAWRNTPAWARAAAVLVLVAAPVAAFPSLRDWLTNAVRDDDAAVNTTAPVRQGAPEAVPANVRFVPVGDAFVVQLDAAQAAGELRISAVAGEEAVVTMQGARGEIPIVSEASLRIRNSGQSSASYLLQLPAAVRTVTVRVGARTIAELDGQAITAGATLSLSR